MSKAKRFIKTATVFLVGNVLSKLVGFFLLPLYTNKIDPEAYGEYDLVITILIFVSAIAFFQVWDGMFRLSFDYEDDKGKYRIITNAAVIYLIGIVIYSLIFALTYVYLKFRFWEYAFLYGVLYAIQYFYSYAARVFLDNKLFAISGVVNTLTVAVTNIVLIVTLHKGVESLYIAQIAGCVAQSILIEIKLHVIQKTALRYIRMDLIRAMLKFSIPLCAASASYWLLTGYTKLVINTVLGSYENGIYAIATSLSNTSVILINVVQFAWNEMAYLMTREKDRKATYIKCINLIFVSICYGCAMLCIVVKILFPILIGEKYASAANVVPLLMIGVSANSMAQLLGTFFMTEKATSYVLISTVTAAVVNVLLAKQLSVKFGIMGAVAALSIAFIMLMLVRLYQVWRKMNIRVCISNKLSTVSVVVAYLVYLYIDNTVINILIIAIVAVTYLMTVKRIFRIKLHDVYLRR